MQEEDLKRNCILIELGCSEDAKELTIRAGSGEAFRLALLEMESVANAEMEEVVPECIDIPPPAFTVTAAALGKEDIWTLALALPCTLDLSPGPSPWTLQYLQNHLALALVLALALAPSRTTSTAICFSTMPMAILQVEVK